MHDTNLHGIQLELREEEALLPSREIRAKLKEKIDEYNTCLGDEESGSLRSQIEELKLQLSKSMLQVMPDLPNDVAFDSF